MMNNLMRRLAFLNPVKVRFEICLTWPNGQTIIHDLSPKTNRYIAPEEEANDE